MKSRLGWILAGVPGAAVAGEQLSVEYLMTMQVVLALWPMFLPALYLRNIQRKLPAYFMFLIIALGLLGLVNLPVTFFFTVAAWAAYDLTDLVWSVHVIKNFVAIGLCVWFLPHFKRRVV